MIKVLFLDFDGVINSVRSAVALGGYPWSVDEENLRLFDHVAIAWIRKICAETGSHIVLSSTWRKDMDFRVLAKALDLPIQCATPILHKPRGHEIEAWLQNHKVDKYAIVDDDGDMLEHQIPFFVQTCPYNGLSYENAKALMELLK